VNVLKGKNYFLYILLAINIVLGLIIYHFQESSFEQPEIAFSTPHQSLGFKGVVKFPMILTNILPTNNLKRFVRVSPVLILEKEQAFNEITVKETLIRDRIISYLNTQSEEDILSEKGMNKAKGSIKEIINKLLDQNKVSMIYFQEFRVN
jgi:flagellar basal body-associated protein FliL